MRLKPFGGLATETSGASAAHGTVALADLASQREALVVDQRHPTGLGVLGGQRQARKTLPQPSSLLKIIYSFNF